MEIAEKENFVFVDTDQLGTTIIDTSSLDKHINAVINYDLVNVSAIKKKNFKVVIDVVNSTGAIALPVLLHALGVTDITVLNGEVTEILHTTPNHYPNILHN
ncbi:MAG: hypothetical protein WDM71_10150 [Ferruginibacter sp.]